MSAPQLSACGINVRTESAAYRRIDTLSLQCLSESLGVLHSGSFVCAFCYRVYKYEINVNRLCRITKIPFDK